MKTITTIAALLMIACAAPVQMLTSYQGWDENKDGAIQRNEFVDGYTSSNYFKRWSNGGSSISYDDFLNDAFSFIDKDRSAGLDKNEFDSQINAYYFKTQSNSFEHWDKNSDDSIDKMEFTFRAKVNNLAPLWDNDNDKRISEYEMASGMYDLCNTNNDTKVDQQEFDTWRAKRSTVINDAQVLHQRQ